MSEEETEVSTGVSVSASETESVDVSVDPSTSSDKAANISHSIGTGYEVYSGPCKFCGSRVASGIVKEGKVNCPTCKRDF